MPFPQFHNSFTYKFKFVAQLSHLNCTIKLVNNSTATLEYMRKVRTVFCPDFLAQYKSIPLWRSTVFGWTALTTRSSRSVWLSPPAQWTTRRCWRGCGRTALDPLLTQNTKKADRSGWKQWKIRLANGGKKHKSEPKRLRFALETTYGPEGRGFESLTAYQKSSESSDFEDFCFS